MISHYYNKY